MTAWVTFDLDNTLVKSPFWRLHLRPWLESQASRRGTDYLTLWGLMHQEGEQRWHRGDWVASFDWPDIARQAGLPPLPDPEAPARAAVMELVLPGAEEALRQARRLGFRVGLVTNGFLRFQRPYLEALGWDGLFDTLVTPDTAGWAKPAAGIMDAVSPGAAHIGDRLSHDVLVAQRTQRAGILVGPARHETDRLDPHGPEHIVPDAHVDTLESLPAILDRLLSGLSPV